MCRTGFLHTIGSDYSRGRMESLSRTSYSHTIGSDHSRGRMESKCQTSFSHTIGIIEGLKWMENLWPEALYVNNAPKSQPLRGRDYGRPEALRALATS